MMSVDERYRIEKFISQAEYRTLEELNAFCDFTSFLSESGGRTVIKNISNPGGQVTYSISDHGKRTIELCESEEAKRKKQRRAVLHTRIVAYAAFGLSAAALALQVWNMNQRKINLHNLKLPPMNLPKTNLQKMYKRYIKK